MSLPGLGARAVCGRPRSATIRGVVLGFFHSPSEGEWDLPIVTFRTGPTPIYRPSQGLIHMAELTDAEIATITKELVSLRKKIQETGATVLSPTPAWNTLRKEIALLNKKLNADTTAKKAARDKAKIAE